MRALVALLLAATVNTGATATNEEEYTFLTPFDAICTTKQIFAETIARYGEVPIMRGQSLRNVNGAMVVMNTVLFMNMQTGSWTLAEHMGEDAFCVVAMGQNWEVYNAEQFVNPGVKS
jgi:hypothetical protein